MLYRVLILLECVVVNRMIKEKIKNNLVVQNTLVAIAFLWLVVFTIILMASKNK
tara:strand:- start:226 stop:387 length:162 start_codon:yes stop_codon:yes gene_type:complete